MPQIISKIKDDLQEVSPPSCFVGHPVAHFTFVDTGCPTSYWIVNGSRLRFSGLIRKFKKNVSILKNV